MVTRTLMSLEEFAALPDDGWRYELDRGELRRMPGGGVEHGGIISKLDRRLGVFVEDHELGLVVVDTNFVFGDDPPTIKVPDAAFFRADRMPSPEVIREFSRVAPDLAVEVASPSDEPGEIKAKVDFYLAHDVPLVWVLYPSSRQVAVHRPGQAPRLLNETDTLDGEDIVPGFQLLVADLFR